MTDQLTNHYLILNKKVPIDRPVITEKHVPFPVVHEKPVAVHVPVKPAVHHHEQEHHGHGPQHFAPEHQHSYTSFSGYGGEYSYHH